MGVNALTRRHTLYSRRDGHPIQAGRLLGAGHGGLPFWGNARGVTLLEVMVALGIAALVLVTVYRLQTQSIAMESAVQFHTVAPLLAEKIMAQIDRQLPDIPNSDQGRFEDDFDRYSWEFATREAGEFSTPTGQPILKQIDIRIYRHDTDDHFSLRTYRLAVPAP
jgi:general secretion pathway protein I